MSPDQQVQSVLPRAPVAGRGFTLIELLVVIAIVGLLLAVSVPAVQGVRESARKTECLDHLHQLAVALQHHESTYGKLPKDNDQGWGVLAFLLPEIEQKPLYDQLRPQQNARGSLAPTLQSLLKTEIPVLWCPSYPEVEAPTAGGDSRTTYLGPEGLFSKRLTLSDVIDGERM
ncbi:MAG: type II secretion system protein [Planctomycetaceae bacterium]